MERRAKSHKVRLSVCELWVSGQEAEEFLVFDGFVVSIIIDNEVVVCFDSVFFDDSVKGTMTWEIFCDSLTY